MKNHRKTTFSKKSERYEKLRDASVKKLISILGPKGYTNLFRDECNYSDIAEVRGVWLHEHIITKGVDRPLPEQIHASFDVHNAYDWCTLKLHHHSFKIYPPSNLTYMGKIKPIILEEEGLTRFGMRIDLTDLEATALKVDNIYTKAKTLLEQTLGETKFSNYRQEMYLLVLQIVRKLGMPNLLQVEKQMPEDFRRHSLTFLFDLYFRGCLEEEYSKGLPYFTLTPRGNQFLKEKEINQPQIT